MEECKMAGKEKVIPATLDRFASKPISRKTKRRVAAYARVSTDEEEQLNSYEAQVRYYSEYIKSHPDWEFVEVYSDEGISGTHTEKRAGFRRMMDDAIVNGRIDLILTKSVSRIARNTVDSLTSIRELKAKGVSIVYISHKMDEILRISDEVTIMRDGQYIGTWASKELTTDFIITKMVGRELTNLYPKRENVPGEVVFEVEDFTSINPKSFRHASFSVRKGEILGVAGLVGAQRTELMEGLFGLRCHSSGTITYKGKELKINQPRDAINSGIAMLTEDRRATGILGVLSIADNVSVSSLNKYLIGGIMLDDKKIEELVQENVAKLSIKTPSSKTLIQSLSGGNQQKVLISRWLANDPDVFILDEPTRGIDVGAKYEIYCIIAELAKQGKSIIMISSEMSELIGMSDRIMVMCDGRVTGFIDGKDANQENIMALATQFE